MDTLQRRVGEKLTLAIGPYRVELEVLQAGNGVATLVLDKAPRVAEPGQVRVLDRPSPAAERKRLERNPQFCYGG